MIRDEDNNKGYENDVIEGSFEDLSLEDDSAAAPLNETPDKTSPVSETVKGQVHFEEKEASQPAPVSNPSYGDEGLSMNISPNLSMEDLGAEPSVKPQSHASHDEREVTQEGRDSSDSGSSNLPVQAPKEITVNEVTPNASGLRVYHDNPVGEVGDSSDDSKKGRMGDHMVTMGLITENQLNVGLQEKKITGRMLGEILVDLGFITQEELTEFLAKSSGFDLFDPKTTIFDGDALALIDKKTALKHHVLPISIRDEKDLLVAMADPYDIVAIDSLRALVPKHLNIKPMVSNSTILSEAIDVAYGYASSITDILKELEEGGKSEDLNNLDGDAGFTHPIVRLVNALVFDAVKAGVSDLHFEPEENFIRLRYRLDGVLFTAQILHKQHWNGISQRIKIISKMNIADKLSPQDGRFSMNVGGKEADFRVSSLPTVHGENIVMRVLDQSSSIMPMAKLGFSEHNLNLIKKSQSKPEGIIIVTGPTGSGKTTSLYSMLNEINNVEVNIQTLEDPVEYALPMIRQTYVREGVLDFADGIKALLRQDPDIIFIGEIRDGETAGMALKAAMTGHQVYTTLHTNDSFGAIPRLFDLGLKPGMVAGSIIAIFAQRLTRRLCGSCREEYTPDVHECEALKVDPANPPKIFRAAQGGCQACSGQGYKGRIAVVEILTFDDELNELLAQGANKAQLKNLAVKKGFKSMKDDGILKVLEGITSIEAVSKVVDMN